jgi:DNA repair exonuclease SbcCD ATPase subunit
MVDSEENVAETSEITTSEEVQQNDQSISENESEKDQTAELEEDSDNDEEESEVSDDQTQKVDWVKKRLAQKDRQTDKRLKEKDREIEYLRQQVSAIYQPYSQDYLPPQGQIYDPTTGQYVDEDSVDGKLIKKLQQIQEVEKIKEQIVKSEDKKKSAISKINDLKNQYDDFEDVFKKSSQNLTKTMQDMMIDYPNSVETFYDLAKNHPEKLADIAKMPDYQQVRAINFLEFQKERSVPQKLKSNAPSPVTPVKSTTTYVDNDSYDSILARQRQKLEEIYGKK